MSLLEDAENELLMQDPEAVLENEMPAKKYLDYTEQLERERVEFNKSYSAICELHRVASKLELEIPVKTMR